MPPLAFCLLQLQRSWGEGGSGSGVAGKAAHECIAKRRSIFTITRHLMQVGITMDDATNRCGSCIRMGARARKIFEAAVARRRLRITALKYATTDTLYRVWRDGGQNEGSRLWRNGRGNWKLKKSKKEYTKQILRIQWSIIDCKLSKILPNIYLFFSLIFQNNNSINSRVVYWSKAVYNELCTIHSLR